MSSSDLPDRASLEYLKKLAKETLREMRRTNPDARLSAAQLEVAREHGFPAAAARAGPRRADRRGERRFYGQREFGILDPNGVELMFSQPIHES